MSKIFKPLIMSALVAGAVGNVQAESEVMFISSAGMTQKSLQYGFEDTNNITRTADASFVGLNIGLTAAFDSFYVSAEIDQALTEGELDNNFLADVSSDSTTVTIGCNCIPGVDDLTMFTGFTSIDILVTDLGTGFDGNHSGLFFGASYPFVSSSRGQLAGTVAYAVLDGRSRVLLNGDAVAAFTGDTTGLSYGVAWTGAVSKKMNYSISAKINDYSFDANKLRNVNGLGDVNFKFDRIFTIFGAKLSYFF